MQARPRRYRLSPRAGRDLEEIWDYTVERWSAAQAEKYHARLITAFESLAQGKKGRPSNVRDGYWKLPAGSHLIYYTENAAARSVDIIRILHQRMDVERHL